MSKKWFPLALSALCMSKIALAALSPEASIMAPPAGENADWGQVHASTVMFKWVWPSGVASAQLTVVANNKSTVLSQELSDTSISSYSWNCGVPYEDKIYDVTLAFDNGETQVAQLYALRGSFDLGVEVKRWTLTNEAIVKRGEILPYRASWGDGLSGSATFAFGVQLQSFPYSSGYFRLVNSGQQLATLDFEVEPSSPAFSKDISTFIGFCWFLK